MPTSKRLSQQRHLHLAQPTGMTSRMVLRQHRSGQCSRHLHEILLPTPGHCAGHWLLLLLVVVLLLQLKPTCTTGCRDEAHRNAAALASGLRAEEGEERLSRVVHGCCNVAEQGPVRSAAA